MAVALSFTNILVKQLLVSKKVEYELIVVWNLLPGWDLLDGLSARAYTLLPNTHESFPPRQHQLYSVSPVMFND